MQKFYGKTFVVATETGILYRMRKQNPEKEFIPMSDSAVCKYMKMITLDKVYLSLKEEKYQVKVPKNIAQKAHVAYRAHACNQLTSRLKSNA